MSDRCHTCDRPAATAELAAHKDGCAECVAHCWRDWGVLCEPAPWRDRAIAAEKRIATLEAALTEACNVLASAWSLIAAEGIAEDDERDELRRINRLRSLIKETP